MSSKYLQPTTIKDALTVAKNIRVEDQREIEGLGHTLGILPWCVVNSVRPVTLYHNEKPDTIVGVCGIVPDEDNPRIGSVWLICTQDVETVNPITFIRESKRWLESESSNYDALWNLADARNHLHHKFLKLLGFKSLRVTHPAPYYIPYLEIVKLCA